MLFTIVGEVSHILPLQEGVAKSGKAWKSQSFVLSVKEDKYVDAYCFNAFGDKVDRIPELGQQVSVKFDIRSREYNGRWYTELNLFSVEPVPLSGDPRPAPAPQPAPAASPQGYAPSELDPKDDDLPF